MEKIKELTPTERQLRIINSEKSGTLKSIKYQSGFEIFFEDDRISQEEKDYVLFHMNQIEDISKIHYEDFIKLVQKFKEENE